MEKAFCNRPITQPPPPKYLSEVPGILPIYSSFANLELNNLLIQEVVDSEANNLEEEELLDLDLDYKEEDLDINFPHLQLSQLNFQKHIKTGKNVSENKQNRKFPSTQLAQFLQPTAQKLLKEELAVSDPEKFAYFLERRRSMSKSLLALAYCLKWRYKNTSLPKLVIMARKILEKHSMPRSMVALNGYKKKDLLVEFNGLYSGVTDLSWTTTSRSTP